MLSGTPLGALLDSVGALYWLMLVGGVIAILVQQRSLRVRLKRLAWLLAIMVGPVLLIASPSILERSRSAARLEESLALFRARCMTAGEKIHQSVEDVQGVMWMKWRTSTSREDQFALDDPFGSDCLNEECILELLKVTVDVERNPRGASRHGGRYRFVESLDRDGARIRYTAGMRYGGGWTDAALAKHVAETGSPPPPDIYGPTLLKERVDQFSAQYGITWDDVSTREDREHWIAGGSLKILDLRTNELIAERIGYMIDVGQGARGGGRSPWYFATHNACPPLVDPLTGKASIGNRSQGFAFRVLKPAE